METETRGEVLSPDQQATIAQNETQKLVAQFDKTRIRKDADLKNATELLSQIKKVSRDIRNQKDGIIKPLNASIKNVRELFKKPEEMLAGIERDLKESIIKYHDEVEKRAANKAAKVEAKIDAGEMKVDEGMAKLTNIKQAETTVKSETGSAQVRIIKKLRITNPAELPASYLTRPSVMEALRKEVQNDVFRLKKDVPAGAEVYEEKGVAAF